MELLHIAETDDGLIVEGEIDLSSAADLQAALSEATASGKSVVDVSGVTFIDSAGLQILLSVGRSLNGSGPLVLRDPSRSVQRLFDIAVPGGVPEIVVVR